MNRIDMSAKRLGQSGAPPVARTESDATLVSLAAIWREILRLPEVGASDNFFDIGGDSLAAVRVIQALESKFDLALPVHAIFEAPTLERMVSRIELARAGGRAQYSSDFVFPLVQTDSGFPLFFNEVDIRLAKANAWTAPCSLYAISHWAQGDGFVRAGSLVELAGAQLAAVRKIQPRGPYRIAGYSFGGLVAYEMAQQLRREGQQVELLFLVDPMAPGRPARIAGAIPLRLFNNKVGRWLIYRRDHQHQPSAVSQALLPMERRPDLWFSTKRLAAGYKARPCGGAVQAVFSDPARRDVWQSILGPDSPLPLIGTAGGNMFEDPALGRWMDDLNICIGELDSPEQGAR